MSPIAALRLAGGLVCVLVLGLAVWKINAWRDRAETLDQVQQAYADYRAQAERTDQERERQKTIDRKVIDAHIATIQKQTTDLAAARTELRGVRLRLAAPTVPARCESGPAPAGAHDPGGDRQPRVVEEAGAGLDAESVAERFAACDAVGARLNALIDRDERLAFGSE